MDPQRHGKPCGSLNQDVLDASGAEILPGKVGAVIPVACCKWASRCIAGCNNELRRVPRRPCDQANYPVRTIHHLVEGGFIGFRQAVNPEDMLAGGACTLFQGMRLAIMRSGKKSISASSQLPCSAAQGRHDAVTDARL
jgi:hypothetical protein